VIVPSGKSMALDSLATDDPSVKKSMDFNNIHIARFGEPVNYYSAEQADAIDLIAMALRCAEGRPEELKDALESIRNFVGMQGVYNLSSMDHYGTRPESMVLLSARDGRWHLEKTFSSLTGLTSVYRDHKTSLFYRLAGMLLAPSNGENQEEEKSLPGTEPSPMDGDGDYLKRNHTFFKDFYRYKRDMVKALFDEDEIKAKHNLYHLLSSSLNMEEGESFWDIVLEIFLAMFDAALEKGVDMENLIGFRRTFMEKWKTLKDKDSLCLALIRSLHHTIDMISKVETCASSLLKRVMSYIRDNYSEDLDVERIARQVCLSPSYLIHRLKKQYGLSIIECIARVRIENAKALLKLTDTSIGTIAHKVGYQDQCYFTKVFKRYTGCTPREYRKSPVKYIRSRLSIAT